MLVTEIEQLPAYVLAEYLAMFASDDVERESTAEDELAKRLERLVSG
ncbi:MAG: hypothetical protein RML32_04105 [Gammaproteobacteria bacterium]|nr:hypothetical protein [Gammaproteobacteria bacterium]